MTRAPLPDGLRIVEAATEEHFAAMSRLHAMGWRDTYVDTLPAWYLAQEITDDRWVPVFRQNYESQNGCVGLLLYRGDAPVSSLVYCPARKENYNPATVCTFDNAGYEDYGEIASFYSHPAERGKGYGGILFEEALRRLKANGHKNAFVFVLRENEKARAFYARHGFSWDGTYNEIPFPDGVSCRDLRYVRAL